MKIKLTKTQKQVLQILKSNKNCYVRGYMILDILLWDFKDAVCLNALELRDVIKTLRKAGHHIIADRRGYCLTNDKEHFDAYIRARRAELRDESITLNCMINGGK